MVTESEKSKSAGLEHVHKTGFQRDRRHKGHATAALAALAQQVEVTGYCPANIVAPDMLLVFECL